RVLTLPCQQKGFVEVASLRDSSKGITTTITTTTTNATRDLCRGPPLYQQSQKEVGINRKAVLISSVGTASNTILPMDYQLLEFQLFPILSNERWGIRIPISCGSRDAD